MRNVLTVRLSCGVLLIHITLLGLGLSYTGRVQDGNTDPFAGAWMSFDVPKQEKEDEDQQERAESLPISGANLGGQAIWNQLNFVSSLVRASSSLSATILLSHG